MVRRAVSARQSFWLGEIPSHRTHLRRIVSVLGLRLVWLVLLIALGGLLAAAALLAVVLGVGIVIHSSEAWSLSGAIHPLVVRPPPQDTTIYGRKGQVLAQIFLNQNRIEVPLSRVAPVARQAVLAVEDHGYYRHGALDVPSILRAAIADIKAGRIVQGGSTIAQQLAKNDFTGSAPTLARKFAEARHAIRLERTYTKDQILEMYLNRIYLGNGVYGIETGARYYFDRPASRLTLSRAALLAGLIAAPESFDPIRHPHRARARRNQVLQRMLDLGWVTRHQLRNAARAPLSLSAAGRARWGTGSEPYFVRLVERTFLSDRRFGTTYRERLHRLFQGGLKIYTTLRPVLQEEARAAIRARLPEPTDPQAAVVTIDPRTGAIEAVVGGKDFRRSQFDLATQARRSAGSAFKPFTLTAALEEGIPPARTFSSAEPITIPDCGGTGVAWHVSNAEPGTGGPMSLWDGIKYSVNVVFAQLINEVGPRKVAAVAHRMGIVSPLTHYCPLTLGASPVSVLEMTSGYATLADGGIHCRPFAIARVVAPEGATLYRARPWCRRAIPRTIAAQVTAMLQGVVQGGTGTAADIGRPVAGKTGTAQDYHDAWFVGYVPQMTTGIWVGYPRAEIPMLDVHGLRGFGGLLAAPIWHDYMAQATRRIPVRNFPPPPIPMAGTPP